MPARIGIVTKDPYKVEDDFERDKIEYMVIAGKNKPGEETTIVTLTKLGKKYIDAIKGYELTQEFAVLRNPESLLEYIKRHLDISQNKHQT